MADIPAIREAIRAKLDPIPGVQVSAYALADPTPPGIQIPPPGAAYDYSMGSTGAGLNQWQFIIQGFVALTGDIGPQKKLDAMCAPSGASSVKALLEADRTLGGIVDSVQVTEQSPGRQVDNGSGKPPLLG